MVFRPGEEIYCRKDEREFVGRFVSMTFSGLNFDTIRYDGTNFGYSEDWIHILRHKGYKPFENLDVLPLNIIQGDMLLEIA